MPALFAFLIGITAGDIPSLGAPMVVPAADPAPDLAPALNDTPHKGRLAARDRKGDDDETVGLLPSGVAGTITIERRVIIRIPALRSPMVDMPALAPRGFVAPAATSRPRGACLPLGSIRGVSFHDKAGIVFVNMAAGRFQAVLERGCRPMDFQSGFYLLPPADGAICAGRDVLQTRGGLRCTIMGLSRLSPER